MVSTKLAYWEKRLLDTHNEVCDANTRLTKAIERYTMAANGKSTPSMDRIYADWKSMQPKVNGIIV